MLITVLVVRFQFHQRGAWDQLVFNEELNFGSRFEAVTCCHTDMLLCLFNHSGTASRVREPLLYRPRCWKPDDPRTPVAAPPPAGTRHRWPTPWQPTGFNNLHISMRRLGRCTQPTAKCVDWAGPMGSVRTVVPNVPAAVGTRCEVERV